MRATSVHGIGVATFTRPQTDQWFATGQFAREVVLNEYDPAQNSAFCIGLRGPAWFGRGLGNPRARRAYETAGFVETDRFEDEGETWVAMAIRRSPSAGA